MNCAEIRQKFVEYYQNLGFQWLPRAPMLHPSIPMSFVMSAGLVQVETSLANVKNRSGNKFVLVQDCFRHFDLETIGTDNIHLSLFEMPAAFMFEHDGRRQIIGQMWTFITETLGINPQCIWVSYFGGGEIAGHQLPQDDLTYYAWREVGIPESHLVGLGNGHNYWLQGGGFENGGSPWRKCGANTELFYDLGEKKACSSECRPGCRCGRFVEFSNLLFVTHQLHYQTNTLVLMDDPFTEAVIGSERIAMLLQNVDSVFNIAAYRPIIKKIHEFVTNTDLPPELITESERVLADHLRAIFVLVADGAPPPGKNGRERIMKLLIRNVMIRQKILGITDEKFLSELLQIIIDFLADNGILRLFSITSQIRDYFEKEGQRFQRTIEQGYQQLETMLNNNHHKPISGSALLSLEKQAGLPYLLATNLLRQKGLSWKEAEYHHALHSWKQQQISKNES